MCQYKKGNTRQSYWLKKKESKKTTSQDKGVNETKIKQETIELTIEAKKNLLNETNNIVLQIDLRKADTKPGNAHTLLGTI